MNEETENPPSPSPSPSSAPEPPSAPEPAAADPAEGRGLATARAVDPQKLLRVAGVTREVLEEARRIRPEAGAIDHLRRVHGQICRELEESLPPELYEELRELTPELRDGSLEELALAHAEILGWLEGLFQGTQLAIQLHAARLFGEERERRLPPSDGERESDGRYL